MSWRTRLTVRVHPRARTERLECDGSTLQLWVREPPADGRANAAVIHAVARWADVAPSQVAIVSGVARDERVGSSRCPAFACRSGCDRGRNGLDQDKARSCGAAQSSSGPSGMILAGLMCGCVV